MTEFVLSQTTQNMINVALSNGPGYENNNYVAAYNAIYADLVANGGINSGTLAWFQQAGAVDQQQWMPTAQGTFIWAYTEAAAASEGATITPPDLQAASNQIALTVFQTLADNNFVFNDESVPNGFSPSNIVAYDAGAGITVLKNDAPNVKPPLDYAIWGGSLFATTELQDPTYFTDYNITLQPNTRDAQAILNGLAAGSAAILTSNSASIIATGILQGLNPENIDYDAIGAVLSSQQKTIITWSVLAGAAIVLPPSLLTGVAVSAAAGYILDSAQNTVVQFFSGNSTSQLVQGEETSSSTNSATSAIDPIIVVDPNAPGSDLDLSLVSNSDGSTELIDNSGTASDQTVIGFAAGGLTGDTISISQAGNGAVDLTDTIGSGDTAEISSDDSLSDVVQDFDFSGTAETLKLDNPGGFAGTVYEFLPGNTIDLAGIFATGATVESSNALIVKTSGGSLALQLDANQSFAGDEFDVVSDGNGGSNITFGDPPVTTVPASETVIADQETDLGVFSVADPDAISTGKVLTVVLSDANGFLSAAQVTGGTVSGAGSTTLTLTGGLEAINSELASLTDYEVEALSADDTTGSASFSDTVDVTTSDGRGGADSHQVAVTINSSGGGGTTHVPMDGTIYLTAPYPGTISFSGTIDIIAPIIVAEPMPGLGPGLSSILWGYVDSGPYSVSGIQEVWGDELTGASADWAYISLPADTYPIADYFDARDSDIEFLASAPIACFATGTSVSMDQGEMPIESLAVGNQVAAGQGLSRIKWLGHRRIDCRRHRRPAEVWPIRISAHAFASDQPCRDLWLSPDHAVFVDGVLIPIKHLINGTTIVQEPRDDVTYWHVELERHDVILAEGLPCESYLDSGNRSAFASSGKIVSLHPEFAPDQNCEAIWEAAGCAPIRISGGVVARVAARLRRRASELGCATTRAVKKPVCGRNATNLTSLLGPDWYLSAYPDVAAATIDPARHYAAWGRREGRLPCPEADMVRALGLIDPLTLAITMPDVIAAGVDPVEHFCTTGWRERRRPNGYFETGWYLDAHDVPEGMNPLLHYVLIGESQGLMPSRHFDPGWYRRRYRLKPSVSALAHYLKHRRTQRFSPLATFDLDAYKVQHGATLLPNRDPYAHYL